MFFTPQSVPLRGTVNRNESKSLESRCLTSGSLQTEVSGIEKISAQIMKVDFCQRKVQNLKSNIGWYGKTERHKVGVVTYRREVNQMSDCDKAAVYETFLIDLFQVFSERYGTLQKAQAELSEFDQGKYLAYEEFLDAMTTRNEMIAEILSEEE